MIDGDVLAWAGNCFSTASSTRINIRRFTWLDFFSMNERGMAAVITSEVTPFANFEKA